MEVLGKPDLESYVLSSDDCSDLDLDTEDYTTIDDSDEDPSFEPLEFTRSHLPTLPVKKKSKPPIPEGKEDKSVLDPNDLTSHLSALSLKKKSKPNVQKGMGDRSDEEGTDSVEFISPELNATDQKSFEAVEKLIHSGMIDKLKLDQCKVYLRKHGLRLTGNKEVLLKRIKEHLEIINGGGERKYPVYSFVLNCKGDACTGDVVMFEQNVYEMYSIVSRSASGPSCGKRTVAGRIVKESYGAEKQQHTFTIEVLWSNGEKPLPPLHPLLIKGRNLYRLKTLRQRWEDEGERYKMLSEKHARGSLARSDRDARLIEKEKRKTLRKSKTVNNNSKRTCQPTKDTSAPLTDVRVQHRSEPLLTNRSHDYDQQRHGPYEPQRVPYVPLKNNPVSRRPLDKMKDVLHSNGGNQNHHPSFRGGRENQFHSSSTSLLHYVEAFSYNNSQRLQQPYDKRQPCRFYAQGRCNFGERCKYLH